MFMLKPRMELMLAVVMEERPAVAVVRLVELRRTGRPGDGRAQLPRIKEGLTVPPDRAVDSLKILPPSRGRNRESL
jgi:hypothetical protein